ncbi:putative F-box domain, leucine-rich repeat domain, L domain-containing protein [Medicago truncatula]|uniref:Putative F-box domain, leucine-rich repeat domain, L domain-containing protein n=1 Tax=Medicago truncatula TaxID=3880 RepID=A0A072U291_MEDTR|nr:uncharacterized protein LOC25499163 [Medicago truncatula]KEH23819.1 hypothetical protein MTR_7g095560 [Medicago truncatula]RHN48115.1 putative F-box domain, leucine-rich repeat domain, L domain-containing protein [Medicago truncatula]
MEMERSEKLKTEFPVLPDCVISYIFSKLCLKDLVKTSVLSKLWLHEWGFRMDLNFDIHTLCDYDKFPENITLYEWVESEFTARVDQFMLHYQGDMIRSIRLVFPLGTKHTGVIERMISKVIAKGVKRLELILSYQDDDDADFDYIRPYTLPFILPFDLLSDADSLTYLHLKRCILITMDNFCGLKNLKTLVLSLVSVKQDLIQCLLSNCIHLLDFTLDDCKFKSDLKITSPTLLNLNIVNCRVKIQKRRSIDIIASNLSSLEYSCTGTEVHTMNIKAHMLSKFSFTGNRIYQLVGFSGMKNVTTIVLDGVGECISSKLVSLLFSVCLQLEDVTLKNYNLIYELEVISKNLRHLNIIDCGSQEQYSPPISIDAANLLSFEYSGHMQRFSIKAPKLLTIFWNAAISEKNPYLFGSIASFHHIENLAMTMTHSQITELSTILVRFQNLRQLELFIKVPCDFNIGFESPDFEIPHDFKIDFFWILDIAMACQHLQKLSLTIRNSHPENSHSIDFERQRREYAGFSHNDLKYVELHGCMCAINVIELASHILRNVNSLKQITFSPGEKFYRGAGRWTEDSDNCCWLYEGIIHDMLQDEVNEQCQLVVL